MFSASSLALVDLSATLANFSIVLPSSAISGELSDLILFAKALSEAIWSLTSADSVAIRIEASASEVALEIMSIGSGLVVV